MERPWLKITECCGNIREILLTPLLPGAPRPGRLRAADRAEVQRPADRRRRGALQAGDRAQAAAGERGGGDDQPVPAAAAEASS